MEATQNTYLVIPPEQRKAAFRAAGKLANGENALELDKTQGLWFARPGADLEKLRDWLPDTTLSLPSDSNPLTRFTDFLIENGAEIGPHDKVVMDGKTHRLTAIGDKAGKRSLTYVGHLDGFINGWAQNWRASGERQTWKMTDHQPDPAALAHIKATAAQRQLELARETQRQHGNTARETVALLARLPQAQDDHPYLLRKGVRAAEGVHLDTQGRLVIPLSSADGTVRTRQTISADPEVPKKLAFGGEKAGAFFVVGGKLSDGPPLLLAEGYATAASLAESLQHPVVMAIDSGNLPKVAEALHARYPNSPVVIFGDDDIPKPHRPGNPGKEKALEAARLTGGTVILPAFTPDERGQGLTDFNDLQAARGTEAVRLQASPALSAQTPENTPSMEKTAMPDTQTHSLPPDHGSGDTPPEAAVTAEQANHPQEKSPAEVNPPQQKQTVPVPENWRGVACKMFDEEMAKSSGEAGYNKAQQLASTLRQYEEMSFEPSEREMAILESHKADIDEATQWIKENILLNPTIKQRMFETVRDFGRDTGDPDVDKARHAYLEEMSALSASVSQARSISSDVIPESNASFLANEARQSTAEYQRTEDRPPLEAYADMADTLASNIDEPLQAEARPEVAPSSSGTDASLPPDEAEIVQPSASEQPSPAAEAPHSDTTAPEDTLSYTAAPDAGNAGKPAGPDNADEPHFTRPSATPVDLEALIKDLQFRQDGHQVIYSLSGEQAFIDNGRQLVMASPEASRNEQAVLAALLVAKRLNQGKIELTGSDEFKQRALTLILDHNIDITLRLPEQQKQLDELRLARAGVDAVVVTPEEAPGNTPQAQAAAQKPEPVTAPVVNDTAQASTAPAPEKAKPDTRTQPDVQPPDILQGVKGKLLAHGPAPYEHNPDNTLSYFVKIRADDGLKTYWGKELASAIRENGLSNGDVISLKLLGTVPVTINVPVKENGKIVAWGPKNTHRNQWEARPLVDPQRVAPSEEQANPPALLSAYDASTFWRLQQTLLPGLNVALKASPPKKPGMLWMQENGKGRPGTQMVNDTAIPPEPDPAAGTVLVHDRSPDGELRMHLVKADGGYIQGVVRHQDEFKHVIGKLCQTTEGRAWIALNAVTQDGLQPIGHGNAVNQVRGMDVSFDTLAFKLRGEDDKRIVPLQHPERLSNTVHASLGFTEAWRPPAPKADEPKPENKPRPQNTMRPG